MNSREFGWFQHYCALLKAKGKISVHFSSSSCYFYRNDHFLCSYFDAMLDLVSTVVFVKKNVFCVYYIKSQLMWLLLFRVKSPISMFKSIHAWMKKGSPCQCIFRQSNTSRWNFLRIRGNRSIIRNLSMYKSVTCHAIDDIDSAWRIIILWNSGRSFE